MSIIYNLFQNTTICPFNYFWKQMGRFWKLGPEGLTTVNIINFNMFLYGMWGCILVDLLFRYDIERRILQASYNVQLLINSFAYNWELNKLFWVIEVLNLLTIDYLSLLESNKKRWRSPSHNRCHQRFKNNADELRHP